MIEDAETDGGTPTPVSSSTVSPAPLNADDLESTVYEMISNKKWSAALSFVKHNRIEIGNERSEAAVELNDDIALILDNYCKRLIQEKPSKTVIYSVLNKFINYYHPPNCFTNI